LKRALELDPRNFFLLQQLSLLYEKKRRYPEIIAILDRALAIIPDDVDTRLGRALTELSWHADTQPLFATIQSILSEKPDAAAQVADSWVMLALCERDGAAAERALAALGENSFAPDAIILNRTFGEGLVARMRKDEAKARASFTAAREEQEKIVRAQPDYGPAVCVLGLIDAALGRKEEAMREAGGQWNCCRSRKTPLMAVTSCSFCRHLCLGRRKRSRDRAVERDKALNSRHSTAT
jgi:tetratricopeptide (TPR) repeat protein